MIELDPILKTAQDGNEHVPIISLVSTSFTESIPFEGNKFNSLIDNETNPDIIEHTTGRLVAVVNRGNDIILLVTDTDKIEWSEYTLYAWSGTNQACLCELSNGDIAIVFINSTYDVYSMIVDTAGEVQTSASLINNYSTWIASVSVELLSNGTFILVYVYLNGSNEYSISKRTSGDFLTWTSVTSITPTGLDNTLRIDNTHIRQLTSGEIFLLFDYVDDDQDGNELVNCYLMRSSDNGTTWMTPEVLTSYTTHGTSGKDPVIAERADGSIEIAFYEEKGVLQMDETSSGWNYPDDMTTTLSYNSSNNKLYAKQIKTGLKSCVVIDVATWTIDKFYSGATLPAIPPFLVDKNNVYYSAHDEGKWIVSASSQYYDGEVFIVIDTELDTITTYVFSYDGTEHDAIYAAYGLVPNIDIDYEGASNPGIQATWVDSASNRLYVLLTDTYLYTTRIILGYIDLTEQPDPITGKYTWNQLFHEKSYAETVVTQFSSMEIDVENNLVILSFAGSAGLWIGALLIYDLTSGGQLYDFDSVNTPGFPHWGPYWCIHLNGHIYGGFEYTSLYGDVDRYGLMDINLSTGSILYHRPSWGTYDDYGLRKKKHMGDGRILIDSTYGITIFDPSNGSWVLYDEDNVPGINLPETDENVWKDIDYDPVNKIIFACAAHNFNGGIVAFPENGEFSQIRYTTGTKSTDWGFSESVELVEGYSASQPAIVIGSNDTMWSLWSNKDATEQSLYWDQESAAKELLHYLTTDQVTASWEIDRPGTLTFALSHGHLFDPSNSMSTLAQFLKKGRKIVLQLGETVAGTDYFQDQGTFVIKESSLSYKRESYPTINVSCEDLSMLWSEGRIIATEYFDNDSPENILSNLLQDHTGLLVADIDIPTIENSHNLYHQFIDQDLREMLDLILSHFGYFLFFIADGSVSARKIDLIKEVDHIYTGKVIDYTPDDSFSSFTNRVVCKGEGRYDIEVLYDMESVGNLAGTVLPFGGTEIKRVWYSEDHVRTCRDPQLNINTSIREYELFLFKGGGNEYISAVDTDEQYVDITMEAPDLTGVFIALAAAIVATGTAALSCGASFSCGPFIFALSIETQLMGYALGSIAQYDYEVYAKPIGHENQTFQAEANDLVSQRELDGQIITDEIDDPFCYEIAHCQRVATQELEVVKAQRSRIFLSKISHLQDEIGDMLQIQHPYTGLPLKIFLTKLSRIYQKGRGVMDNVEGWKI